MVDLEKDKCPVDEGLPTCSTGPGGRIMFVIREITQAIRSQRACRKERKRS